MKKALLLLLILAIAGIPASSTSQGEGAPPLPPSGWVQHFVYTPATPNASAFFFRLLTTHTACLVITLQYRLPWSYPLPMLTMADAAGSTFRPAGVPVIDGPYGSGLSIVTYDPIGTHQMVNLTAGNITLYQSYNETGYDRYHNIPFFWGKSSYCQTDPFDERWFYVMASPFARNLTLTVDLYEGGSWDTGFTVGEAKAIVTYVAESNRTFFAQLRDFKGTMSYSGNPVGLGDSAGAANVEYQVTMARGYVGGFTAMGPEPETLKVMSYTGPGAKAGPASTYIQGPAGPWTLRAHAYLESSRLANLYAWGADLETGTTQAMDWLEAALP